MVKICRDFTIVYVLTLVGLGALGIALEVYAGFDIGNAATIMPVLVGAFSAGQLHGRRTGMPPTGAFSWRAAVWMVVITLALSLIVLGALWVSIPQDELAILFDGLNQGVSALILVFLAVVLVIELLLCRYIFAWGARQMVKLADKETIDRF
jgi:hypothetical protein